MIRIFLDDERFPVNDGEPWIICRNFNQFKSVVDNYFPNYVSFDHDLGNNSETGYKCAEYLVNKDLDTKEMPDDFSFYVHSQNPIGKVNIEGLLFAYLKERKNDL